MTRRTRWDSATKLWVGTSIAALCVAAHAGAGVAQEAAIELPDISVEGRGPARSEKAEGPVKGYVASRSATGSKTDTPLVETPQSISVVTREEFEDRGATTLQDVLSYTPGVASFSSGRSIFLDEFDIRGFSSENGNLGQLRDGLKLQANVYDGAQEPYAFERVEILKGPASILYGQLAPGGVINSISKRPTFTPQGEINLTGGSFETKQISGDISGSIGGPDSDFAFRLTGLLRDADTFVDHVPNDRRYIAPALTWAPTDDTSLTLLAYYQEIRTRFVAPMDAIGTVIPNAGGRRVPRDFFIGDTDFDRYNINSGAIGYVFDHDFNENVKFSSRARYFEAKADWDYLTFDGFTTPTTITRSRSQREEHSKVWTTDNHFQFKFGTGPIEHTAVVGIDYARQNYDTTRLRDNGGIGGGGTIDIDTGVVTPPTTPINPRLRGFERTVEQVGVYAQDQLKLWEKFVFLAGIRKDWATTDFQYDNPAFATLNGKQKNDDLTARLGFVYLGPYGFAPYVSYSESFSPVIAAERTSTEPFKPTTGEQYEAGVRWTSPDGKTLVTAAVYQIEQENLVTGPIDNLSQAGLVRSRGFELEGKTEIDSLRLSASFAYTNAKTIEDENSDIIGQQLATIPKYQASIWGVYDFTTLGAPGFSLGAGARYVGKTNLPEAPSLNIPSYVMVDAVAKLDLGKLSPSMQGFHAQLNAKNLFDKKTISCALAVQGCDYGQPRTILATLSYKW